MDSSSSVVPWDAMGVRAVFLVGFMACGKSCVGQQLARRLNWDFIDLDAHIEAREGQTIPDIFEAQGEAGFRLAETAALRELTDALERDPLARNTVIALGGGTFAQAAHRELLRPWPSVFLEAPVDELWQRSVEHAAKRPLRRDRNQFATLYEDRLPYYRQASVTVVTSGKDPASLCAEIERSLHTWRHSDDPMDGEKSAARNLSHSPSDYSGTGEIQ